MMMRKAALPERLEVAYEIKIFELQDWRIPRDI
jgi:hypothetical protein